MFTSKVDVWHCLMPKWVWRPNLPVRRPPFTYGIHKVGTAIAYMNGEYDVEEGLKETTMDFRPREALFFGDNFFKLVTIGFKFSYHPFQPKRRYPSIWSLNKMSKFRVPTCH